MLGASHCSSKEHALAWCKCENVCPRHRNWTDGKRDLRSCLLAVPYDIYDAALTATISDFPVSIQPFRDMVSCALWKRCREACRKACLAPVHPTSVDCCLSTGQPAASACSKDITSVCRRSEVLMMCCSD